MTREDLASKLGSRPDVPGGLAGEHGAAIAGQQVFLVLGIGPVAVLGGIVVLPLWVTGVTLWAVGRRGGSSPPKSICPAQRVVYGATGQIGPVARKE